MPIADTSLPAVLAGLSDVEPQEREKAYVIVLVTPVVPVEDAGSMGSPGKMPRVDGREAGRQRPMPLRLGAAVSGAVAGPADTTTTPMAITMRAIDKPSAPGRPAP
jgi:hypothetical protein